MNKKKRSKREERQLITAKRIVEQKGYNNDEIESVLTLYQSIEQAKGRAGKVGKYKEVHFLLGDNAKQATINVIERNPIFWSEWKYLQENYELSGYNPDQRQQIHRLDSNGHYELENIVGMSRKNHVEKHSKEREKPTQLFAIDKNGGLRLGFFESKTKAQAGLNIGEKRLNKMIKGDYEYKNDNEENMIFLRLEPSNEPAPVRTKAEQDEHDKQSYIHTVKKIEQLKEWQTSGYAEHRVKTIAGLEKRIEIYEANGFHLL